MSELNGKTPPSARNDTCGPLEAYIQEGQAAALRSEARKKPPSDSDYDRYNNFRDSNLTEAALSLCKNSNVMDGGSMGISVARLVSPAIARKLTRIPYDTDGDVIYHEPDKPWQKLGVDTLRGTTECFSQMNSDGQELVLREACRLTLGSYVIEVTGAERRNDSTPPRSPGVVEQTKAIKEWLEAGARG